MRPVLRLLLLVSTLVVVAGTGFALWKAMFGRTTTLRLAVTSLEGDEARLAGALNRWMASRNGRYRLRPVVVTSVKDGLDAVVRRDADLAIARADTAWPAGVSSGVVMYRTKLVLLAGDRGAVTSLAQLQGKTIGLLGSLTSDDPLLTAFLALHGLNQTRVQPLSDTEIAPALTKGTVQALAYASVLAGAGAGNERVERLLRSPAGRGLQILGLPDGEATARQDRRFDSHDLAPGQLRAQPPLPSETESVLSVAHHLVLRRGTPSMLVSRFIGELVDAKRGVLAAVPLAGQIDAPDEEINAAAPVHPGASAYFNDEDLTLAELVSEWGYLVLVVLGGLASGLVWLIHRLWPQHVRSASAELLADFLALRREAARGPLTDDLRARFEMLMQRLETALAEGALAEEEAQPVLAAADMADRMIPPHGLSK